MLMVLMMLGWKEKKDRNVESDEFKPVAGSAKAGAMATTKYVCFGRASREGAVQAHVTPAALHLQSFLLVTPCPALPCPALPLHLLLDYHVKAMSWLLIPTRNTLRLFKLPGSLP